LGTAPKYPVAVPTLDELAHDPALAASLPVDVARYLLVQANVRLAETHTAHDALVVRLAAGSVVPSTAEPKNKSRTLDANEIATALGQKRRWVFANVEHLPFVRRISRKALAADEAELLRWRAMQKS
jgi:hypothetical protein